MSGQREMDIQYETGVQKKHMGNTLLQQQAVSDGL